MAIAYKDVNHENLSFSHCNPTYILYEKHFIKLVIIKVRSHMCHSGAQSSHGNIILNRRNNC